MPDPDGVHRCFRHSRDPETIAKREALDDRNRQAGVDGKKQELAHRRKETKARAQGRGKKVPRRKGKRGPTPNADPVPKAGAKAAAETETDPDAPEGFVSFWDRLKDHNLETAEGRKNYRVAVIRLKAEGDIDARDADLLLRAASDQAKDKRPQRSERSLQVRWELIATPEQGAAFREARRFLQDHAQ